MVNTIRYVVLLLPALAWAQNTVVSVTVNSQVTGYELPAFTATPSQSAETPASAPPVGSESGSSASSSQESPSGTSIPVTIANQETTMVLPYWSGTPSETASAESSSPTESAPGTTGVVPVPVPVPVPTSAIASIVSSAVSGISGE